MSTDRQPRPPAPMPNGLDKYRAEAVRLMAEIKEREDRLTVLRELVRENLESGTYGEDPTAGQIIVSNPTRQFSLEVAQAMIPAERFPWKTVPDKDKIKEMDPSGRLYDDCLVVPASGGTKKVTFT